MNVILLKKLAMFACCILPLTVTAAVSAAEKEPAEGTIATFWPLFDYRESPREGFSNLAILGPLFKYQRRGTDRQIALRPLFHRSADDKNDAVADDYLYPLASATSSPAETSLQVYKFFQKNVSYRDGGEAREERTMLFPFYISGTSPTYGPYLSLFPFYGDIYERFWRDEYHFVLFPLYGRTVKNGTTSTNILYPLFNVVSGERESGFQIWPLYGQAAKEGVYRRRFLLWPFYLDEESGLDGDNPTKKRSFLPFYVATDSPRETGRTWFWPFFGYRDNPSKGEEERDYFWPFLVTARSGERTLSRFLPFYAEDINRESGVEKFWYFWPVYRRDAIMSSTFRQERDRVLYFLFSDSRESWPVDGRERRRTALWPLFVYSRDERGVSSLTLPAPVEPVLDREGIEKSYAPLWRIYNQRWNDSGESALSLFWNLYWHEIRGAEGAWELFPLFSYRDEQRLTDFSLFKGLIRYTRGDGLSRLTMFWLPFGPSWGTGSDAAPPAGTGRSGREGS